MMSLSKFSMSDTGLRFKHGLIERQMPELRKILNQSAGTSGFDSLRMVRVAPTEARIMQVIASHCAKDKCS